ncbi:MAG: HepT-like ribonuclease domain-containing protein [Thermodesulfobacteriota bacterium]
MQVDERRIKKYLYDILSNIRDIESLLKEHGDDEILGYKHFLKSLKYSLVEISEAISLVLQHILAKHYGLPVKGYIDTIEKASDAGIISPELSASLRPFFDFRNSLVHRYWIIDDRKLLANCRLGYKDFSAFIEAIEGFLETI